MADRLFELGWMRVLLESGRRGSLSAAAQELGLTQPAVSYQIRRLEEQLGVPILKRQHRGVDLTPEGQRLYELVLRQVGELDALVHEFRQPTDNPLVRFYADHAFASLWLMPRMQRLRERHGDLNIQIIATQNPVTESLSDDDVIVTFGTKEHAGRGASLLVGEKVVPVCAPAYSHASNPGSKSIAGSRLVHLDSAARSDWFDWTSYFDRFGIDRTIDSGSGDISLNTYTLVIEATLKMQGVALGWSGLVDDLIANGALIAIGDPLEEPSRGYWLSGGGKEGSAAARLTHWLMDEVAA